MNRERTKNGTIRLAADTFDAAYRHLSDGVIVCGRDGVILYGNPAAEKAFGRNSGELAGHALDEIVPADAVTSGDGAYRVSLPGFELKFHTKNQVGGTGLGLSICNLMAARMGGKITIDSEVGVGSSFTVELPRIEYQADAPADDEPERSNETKAPPADFDLSLLLVDDSELNLKVLEALCRKLGVKKIDTAVSGTDALAKMNGGRYDAVLTDVWMPNMSGSELAEEFRRNPKWHDLPVYALTADVEMCKRDDPAPFTGILLKPLRMESISELLLRISANRK